jgi:hypothetical protein
VQGLLEQERWRCAVRALAQRVEVAEGELRIIGSKSRLLQTLTAKSGASAVPVQGLNWRPVGGHVMCGCAVPGRRARHASPLARQYRCYRGGTGWGRVLLRRRPWRLAPINVIKACDSIHQAVAPQPSLALSAG